MFRFMGPLFFRGEEDGEETTLLLLPSLVVEAAVVAAAASATKEEDDKGESVSFRGFLAAATTLLFLPCCWSSPFESPSVRGRFFCEPSSFSSCGRTLREAFNNAWMLLLCGCLWFCSICSCCAKRLSEVSEEAEDKCTCCCNC